MMQPKARINFKYLILSLIIPFCTNSSLPIRTNASAKNCPEVRVFFARGSGAERWTNSDYLEFKARLQEKFNTVNLSYDFIDLDYPAPGVGMNHLDVTLGAFISGGESYEFGDSVRTGVRNLVNSINNSGCKDTKYVLGGYSQGAMVILKSLELVNPEQIVYVATFGDPKIYLPEGKGAFPAACSGKNLSRYRMYVPDCHAYMGILGSYIPYEPNNYSGKIGTWCNKYDILCSSHLSFEDHAGYVDAGLYEDASRLIFNRVLVALYLQNTITYPHDVAFLIDSSESMKTLYEEYKPEIIKMAEKVIAAGGRVSLFDYRDLSDPYNPTTHCVFDGCTLDVFRNTLNTLTLSGGGDIPESTLSAALYAMRQSGWRVGSVKSLIVLTDALFHSPDRDGTTINDVVKLSQSIDPVNIYFITTNESTDSDMYEVAERTDGQVLTDFRDIDAMFGDIMERFDSLSRVEEEEDYLTLPVLEINDVRWLADDKVQISFSSTGTKTMLALNDKILGLIEGNTITIGDIDHNIDNEILLVPLSEERRGNGVTIKLETIHDRQNLDNNSGDFYADSTVQYIDTTKRNGSLDFIPRVPNAGKV